MRNSVLLLLLCTCSFSAQVIALDVHLGSVFSSGSGVTPVEKKKNDIVETAFQRGDRIPTELNAARAYNAKVVPVGGGCEAHGPKVFNLGLPRTGTLAFSKTLGSQGMRGCHPFVNKKWTLAEVMAFIKNKTNSELFKMQEQNIDECDVFSDTPIFVMAKMLRWRYPDARFVMTTRELDPWLDSTGRLMEYKCPRIAKGWKEFHRWYYGPGCHDDVVWRRRYVEHHVRMMKMFEGQLLLIPLEMPDDEKFKSLLTYLDCEAVEDTHYIFKQHALGQQTTAGGSGFDKTAP